MNNIVFEIFHLKDKSKERDLLFNKANEYFSKKYEKLNSKTFEIKNKNDLDDFKKEYDDFLVKPEGINLAGIQGWRYGEIGLWATTFAAYKKFLLTNYDILLLVEDDIVFEEDLSKNIEMSLSQAPENWDVIFLFAEGNHSSDKEIYENNLVESYHDWSTLCYLINRQAVNKVIDDIKDGIYLPLDWHFLRQKNKYKSYTISKDRKMSCRPADIKSSFQHQERQIL